LVEGATVGDSVNAGLTPLSPSSILRRGGSQAVNDVIEREDILDGGGRTKIGRLARRFGVVAIVVASMVSALFAVSGGRTAQAADDLPAVRAVAVGGDETATTVTLDLTKPARVGVFALADPDRLVIDLPAVRFDLPKEAGASGRGLVGALRWGGFAPGRARMVFDLHDPVKIGSVDLTAGDGGAARVVIALARGTRADEIAAKPVLVGPVPPGGDVRIGGEAVRPEAPVPTVAAATSGPRRHVVMVDAGHGGVDAGTVSPATGTPEKTVVLEMARVLAHRLEETGRYTVRLTRNSDVFVPLGERVAMARAAHAELFISIHADAEYDHSVRGATVYTLAEKASDARAAALAAKENRSDSIAGLIDEERRDEVADILADLMRRETRRFSHEMARDILEEYRRSGRLVKGAAHREAGLKVLRAHDFPSVLVEIGFLSNKEDEAQMVSPEWRDRSARSLVAAIDRWFAGHGNAATTAGDVSAVGGGAAASP